MTITIEAREVNTSRYGCRYTRSVRFFVVGLDTFDSCERGVSGCAYKTRRAATDAAACVAAHRARRAA